MDTLSQNKLIDGHTLDDPNIAYRKNLEDWMKYQGDTRMQAEMQIPF